MFCANCGTQVTGAFCSECGTKVSSSAGSAPSSAPSGNPCAGCGNCRYKFLFVSNLSLQGELCQENLLCK